MHAVLRCLNLIDFFLRFLCLHRGLYFLFSFVAPDSHLQFRTLLVIANASYAVVSFGFWLYLRPAAVRVALAHFVGFCSGSDLLCSKCSKFYLLSGWACLCLIGCLLAGTALLSQSHDVSVL